MKRNKKGISLGRVLCRGLTVAILALSLVLTLSLAASAETAEVDETAGETTADEPGFLDSALSSIGEHLPLLLSSMTLIGTAWLARLFRSSLLPILDSGMKRVGGGVSDLEEKTRALLTQSERELCELSALVSRLTETAGGEAERAATLKSALDGSIVSLRDSVHLEAERLDAVLLMLKEVFTAARLPAASKLALEEIYRKTPMSGDRVGETPLESEGSL